MDIDSRGIRRGQCKAEGCDCDQFERPVSATACAYCGDPPTKHEKLPPLSKSQDDESGHGVSEGVCCSGSEETQIGSNSCRSNRNDAHTVNTHLKSNQILDAGQSVSKDLDISSGQKLTDMENSYQGTSRNTQVKRSASVFSSETQHCDSTKAASVTRRAQHTEETHYKRDDPGKPTSITRKAQYTEEVLYQREDPSVSTCTSSTGHHTGESVLVSSSKQKIDGLNDGERSETVAVPSEEGVRQISNCSESSRDDDRSDESYTDLVQPGNEIIPQSGNTDFSGMKLQNIEQVTIDTGNIHIHNNTELNVAGTIRENIKSQSKTYLQTCEKEDSFYVKTKAYGKVESILSEDGHVTIYGNAGDGKTTMANHLLLRYAEGKGYNRRKYESLKIYSPEEFRSLVNMNRYQIVLVDDVFGMANLDRDKLNRWVPILKDVNKQHRLNHEFAEEDCNPKTLLIFTSRNHIVKEACTSIDEFKFFKSMYIVNLSDSRYCLMSEEKRDILTGLAKRRKREIDENTIEAITAHIDLAHGFPHCADLFTEHENLFSQGIRFFEDPLTFLRKEIEIIGESSKEKYCCLIVAMINNGRIDKDGFGNAFTDVVQALGIKPISKSNIIQAANQLLGSYFYMEGDSYIFLHPSLIDALAYVFVKEVSDIQLIIQSCGFSFISERLRIKSYKPRLSEQVITVDESQYSHLSQRFISELMSGNIFGVAQSHFLDDSKFVKVFFTEMFQKGEIEIFFHLGKSSYSKSNSLFFWAAGYGKVEFCKTVLESALSKPITIKNFEQIISDTFFIACRGGNIKLVKLLLLNEKFVNNQFLGNFSMDYDLKYSTPLFQAVKGASLDVVRYLIANGADINRTDSYMNSCLHVCEDGDILNFLIDKGLKPNSISCEYVTPIFFPKSKLAVQVLVKCGADVNYSDIRNQTALFFCENVDKAMTLLHYGSDVNHQDIDGQLAAFVLVMYSVFDVKLLKEMITRGMDVRHQDGFGKTLLHYLAAAEAENMLIIPCLEYLLELVDPNIVDKDGCTALHYASGCKSEGMFNKIYYNNYGTEKAVLERTRVFIRQSKCDLNILNNNSKSALFETQYVTVAEELIKAGADLHVCVPGYDNSLEVLALHNLFSKELVDLFINAKCNILPYMRAIMQKMSCGHFNSEDMKSDFLEVVTKINKKIPFSSTDVELLLTQAVETNSLDLLEIIVKSFSIDSCDISKVSALLFKTKSSAVLEKLILFGLDINVKSVINENIIFFLVQSNLLVPPVLDLLLERGINLSSQDAKGETVLFKLKQNNKIDSELFCALVRAGIDLNVQNKYGHTILHLLVCEGDVGFQKRFENFTLKNSNVKQFDINESLIQCVQCLLDNGADTNMSDQHGRLPIHMAYHPIFAELLIEHSGKSTLHKKDENKDLPVTAISKNGAMSSTVYIKLKNLDVDFNVRDSFGATCLHYCIQYEWEGIKIFPVLRNLIRDTSVNAVTNSGATILQYLMSSNLDKNDICCRMEFLFSNGCKVNISSQHDGSVFHYVKHSEVAIKLLVSHRANIFKNSKRQCLTALEAMAVNSVLNSEILDFFLQSEVQINKQIYKGGWNSILYYILISKQSDSETYAMLTKLLKLGLTFGTPVDIADDIDPKIDQERIQNRIACVADILTELDKTDLKLELQNILERVENLNICTWKRTGSHQHFYTTINQKADLFSGKCSLEDRLLQLLNGSEADGVHNLEAEVNLILTTEIDTKKRYALMNNTLINLVQIFLNSSFGLHILVSKGADIHLKTTEGKTLLHLSSSFVTTSYLIRCGADINAEDDNGCTPLFFAKETISLMRLLSKGADVNHRNHSGKTALHCVESLKTAKCLISYGADINAKDISGKSPVECITDARIKEYLVKRGCHVENETLLQMIGADCLTHEFYTFSKSGFKTLDIFGKIAKSGFNVELHALVMSEKSNKYIIPILNFLLLHGADPNAQDDNGNTAANVILWSIYKRNLPISLWEGMCEGMLEERLKVLLEKGTDPFIKNLDGQSCFNIATIDSLAKVIVNHLIRIYHDKSSIELILIHFASRGIFVADVIHKLSAVRGNIHLTDSNGRTVLHLLVLCDYYPPISKKVASDMSEFITTLREHKFNFDTKDKDGQTPLSLACQYHHIECEFVDMLLLNGSDPSQIDSVGDSLLEKVSSVPLLVCLIRHETNMRPLGKNSIFHLARRQMITVDVIDALSKRNIDLGECDDSGNNLLHYNLNCDAMKALIKQNVQVNICNVNGQTPLHILCLQTQNRNQYMYNYKYKTEIYKKCQILLDAGADPNKADYSKCCPLEISDDEILVEMLLKNGGLASSLENRNEAMDTLVFLYQKELLTANSLQILNERGADVTVMDNDNAKLLHVYMFPKHNITGSGYLGLPMADFESISEKSNIVLYLVNKGLSVNAKDINGKTPLHFLVQQKVINNTILQILLEKGADWSIMDNTGLLPIPSVSFGDERTHVLCLYAAYFENAKENYIDNKPLIWHYAEQMRYLSLDLLQASISHNIDLTVIDASGNSMIDVVFNYSHDDVWEALHLLRGKISFNIQNSKGQTCFHHLVLNHWRWLKEKKVFEDLFYLFLRNGVDINALYHNHTALDFFVLTKGYKALPGIIHLFVTNGATLENWVVNDIP